MITLAYLDEALNYEEETGSLFWRVDRPRSHFKTDRAWSSFKKRDAGKRAGSVNISTGYRNIMVGGFRVLYHRLVYAIHHGIEPIDLPKIIDHRDRDTLNNKINNLRAATDNENMHNRGMNSNNTSGYKGVSYKKQNDRWVANVRVGGKKIHIGYFDTPEAASAAREAAANDLHGEFARHATHLDAA